MRKCVANSLKIVSFLLCLFFLFSVSNKVFVIKNQANIRANLNEEVSDYYLNRWDGFYQTEENTLDVLFFGGSQVHCDISPMVMYKENGFKSYDLSADQQNYAMRYRYIVEALKYQSPQVIVVDLNGVTSGGKASGNSAHYSYDFMRMSLNKIIGIITTVEKEDWFRLLFPVSDFHTRWKEIGEVDFSYLVDQQPSIFGGFFGYYVVDSGQEAPNGKEKLDVREISDLNREYLDKIVNLCNEKEVKLIFTLLPSGGKDKERFYYNDALEQYAKEKNIPYIDYTYMGEEIGLNYQTDFADVAHLNIWGAEKISRHLGDVVEEFLVDNNDKSETGDLWEQNLTLYEEKIIAQKLRMLGTACEEDLTQYMNMIEQNPNWMAVIVGRATDLVLDFEQYKSDEEFNWNYVAVIDGGKLVKEITSDKAVMEEIELNDVKINVCVDKSSNISSINVEGIDCMNNQRGLNIVVFDKKTSEVIDTKNFDIYHYAYLRTLD